MILFCFALWFKGQISLLLYEKKLWGYCMFIYLCIPVCAFIVHLMCILCSLYGLTWAQVYDSDVNLDVTRRKIVHYKVSEKTFPSGLV